MTHFMPPQQWRWSSHHCCIPLQLPHIESSPNSFVALWLSDLALPEQVSLQLQWLQAHPAPQDWAQCTNPETLCRAGCTDLWSRLRPSTRHLRCRRCRLQWSPRTWKEERAALKNWPSYT